MARAADLTCLPRLLWFHALLRGAASPCVGVGLPCSAVLGPPGSGAAVPPGVLWGVTGASQPVPLPLTPACAFLLQQVPARFPGLGGEFQASLPGMCGWVCALDPGPWGCASAAVTELGQGSKPSLALLKGPRCPFCPPGSGLAGLTLQ